MKPVFLIGNFSPMKFYKICGKFLFILLLVFIAEIGFYFSLINKNKQVLLPPPPNVKLDYDNNNQESNKNLDVGQGFVKDLGIFRDELILNSEDFLELNLQKMSASLWISGKLYKNFSISAKGNPDEWGGAAAGLYGAESKNKIAFSNIARVYMPFAINYYGKYYLHGVPYYSNGGKRITNVTGGCIQFDDSAAKDIFNEASIKTKILVIDKENDDYKYKVSAVSDFPEITAEHYLVADLDSGYIFAKKNSNVQRPIASIAKLMTSVVVTENVDLRKSITIQNWMVEPFGQTKGIEQGRDYRLVELLYPALIESSNDAAQALSGFLGMKNTIDKMNEKAASIYMKDTKYVDANGLSSENVSTAEDVFRLIRYIYNVRPPILKITKGEKVGSFGNIRFTNLENKNIFYKEPRFMGGKTGYTKISKYSGAFVFNFQINQSTERKIAIILLDSDGLANGLKKDAELILDWIKRNY